jgi:hypothetical protein
MGIIVSGASERAEAHFKTPNPTFTYGKPVRIGRDQPAIQTAQVRSAAV